MLVLAHLHRSVLTQLVHSLGHLAFKWRSSFAKALAKLSPNFREKSPNSFYKMIHIYIISIQYKYLQCNLDMCTWTFAKTLARKKNFRHFRKTLADTVNCIPKGLRKGNPFHGPFAQLSCGSTKHAGNSVNKQSGSLRYWTISWWYSLVEANMQQCNNLCGFVSGWPQKLQFGSASSAHLCFCCWVC